MAKKFFIISLLSLLVFSGAVCQRTHYDLGVYKSEDGGITWQQKVQAAKKKKALATQEILVITLDPQNPEVIFIGTKAKGIFKSYDGGETWQKTGIGAGDITSIVIDPKDPYVIYVSAYVGNFGKIYKSDDGGNKFYEIYSETHAQIPVFSLALDWYDTRVIWAGTQKGAILKSDDSGRNWVVKKWVGDEVRQIAISPLDSRHVIVGTVSSGLLKTEDSGKTWEVINKSFLPGEKDKNMNEKLQVHALIFDQNKKGRLYFASKYQLLVSDDEGKKWENIKLLTKPGEASLMKITLDPTDSNVIYLGLDTTIYKSEDGGKNWKVVKLTSGRISAMSVNYLDSAKVYAGIRKPQE